MNVAKRRKDGYDDVRIERSEARRRRIFARNLRWAAQGGIGRKK